MILILSKVADRIQLQDSIFNVIWYVDRDPTIVETQYAVKNM